ncbi:hypothetical protein BSL78_04502 [Apostichopus japonicus]|uniref:Up-regulated during skeletal muscle growth protein 5 n=1 Tax=Stichopus japonicus TaxID=307972 RepID=A0A2G8LE87_STIJA|nr:hypothetical protein BSL78_04502 [Apostichopus japonicus]
MAGGHVDESQFAHYAGFKKYFNADTTFGKRNCVVATYATTFFLVWFVRRRMNKNRQAAIAAK